MFLLVESWACVPRALSYFYSQMQVDQQVRDHPGFSTGRKELKIEPKLFQLTKCIVRVSLPLYVMSEFLLGNRFNGKAYSHLEGHSKRRIQEVHAEC